MNDAMRYQRLCDSGLPLCFEGREYAGKAELDAAIDATLQPYRRKKPISADFVMKPGWSRLLHAAFHLMDDSCEDAQTGQISIDNQIGAADLKELMQALAELEIESHDDLSAALAAAPTRGAPEWQPIETAPKEMTSKSRSNCYGDRIQAYPIYGQVNVCRWWYREDDPSICNFLDEGGRAVYPTQWTNLADAPEPTTAPKADSNER